MLMRRQVPAVQVSVQSNSRGVSVSVSQQSGGSQLCNREQMPQMQFQVATQRQIQAPRVQKRIVIPHVQRLTRWTMFLLCRFTGLRHGKDGRDLAIADRAARR